jgi:hypothetical protein
MKYETMIKQLTKRYNKALRTDYIRKPMSWALYQMWREVDNQEGERPIKWKEDKA